jgi:hypothetical protein
MSRFALGYAAAVGSSVGISVALQVGARVWLANTVLTGRHQQRAKCGRVDQVYHP